VAQKLGTRILFCDWHMPNCLPEIKIDCDEYFEQVRHTGAQTLIFMAKTAHGTCLFPSAVGFTHTKMEGDIFGEIATRAKAHGLQFIAYYNVVLSWELAPVHPEWRQLDQQGRPLRMFLYPCFCMSNDDFAEHVAAHMAEITRNYPIDGFFLDLQYFAPEGCFCSSCRSKFRERFGYELEPDSFGAAQWLDLYTYQTETRERFIAMLRNRCNAIRAATPNAPPLSWSWNGSGSVFAISATLHEGTDYLSTEAHPPEYLHADHAIHYCEGLRKPFTLFMPESQGSWGDWTLTTPETMKGLSAMALAHGGSLNINHVPYPCGEYGGKVPKAVWDTIADTFAWVARREKYCVGKRPVPVVALIHSAYNARLLQAMSRAGKGGHWAGETYGNEHAVAQLLAESHIPWEIRPEQVPLDEMQRYELLILPYMPHVCDELAEKLRAYVAGGGKLLAAYHTSLFGERGDRLPSFSLADLFGVDYVEDSPFSVCYLDRFTDQFRPGVPSMPLLVKDTASGKANPENHALYCRVRSSAHALAYITDPVMESDFDTGHYIYHDHAPPAYVTDYPGIVLNSYGQGQVAYMTVPFFQGYAAKKCPFLRAVFATIVEDIFGVSAKIRVEAPVSVKVSLQEDDEGWLLHLIHIQKQTDSMYLDGFYRPDPITVRVRPGWPVAAAEECVSGNSYELTTIEVWREVTIAGILDHMVIRFRRG
jgi:hypothetical protein